MSWLTRILGISDQLVSLVRIERMAEQLLVATRQAERVCAQPKLVPDIDLDAGDPSPEDPVARREYVARAAGFYKDVLGPKLKELIADQMWALKDPKSTREADMTAKAAVNAFALMMDWGDRMVAEHQADLINQDKDNANG